jgi:Fe2+ or Zn2+ uptake regulation protein
VCRGCHRLVPIAVAFIEDWAIAVAADHGFADVHPVLERVGHCRAREPAPANLRESSA